VGTAGQLAQLVQQLASVAVGQLQIEKQQLQAELCRHAQRLGSGVRVHQKQVGSALEKCCHQQRARGMIVYIQHSGAAAGILDDFQTVLLERALRTHFWSDWHGRRSNAGKSNRHARSAQTSARNASAQLAQLVRPQELLGGRKQLRHFVGCRVWNRATTAS